MRKYGIHIYNMFRRKYCDITYWWESSRTMKIFFSFISEILRLLLRYYATFSWPSDVVNIQNLSNLSYLEAILPLNHFLLKIWQSGSVWSVKIRESATITPIWKGVSDSILLSKNNCTEHQLPICSSHRSNKRAGLNKRVWWADKVRKNERRGSKKSISEAACSLSRWVRIAHL